MISNDDCAPFLLSIISSASGFGQLVEKMPFNTDKCVIITFHGGC